MVRELRHSAILVPEVLIQLMLHKELLKPYFGKQLQQYNSQTTICEPLRTAVIHLEPELNSRCNLQNFGFKLREYRFQFVSCKLLEK
jgi:hypothetical protein